MKFGVYNFISVGGIFVLLGIAFLLSNNKKKVSLKTVFWGLALQVILGVIILNDNWVSFVAIGIFMYILCLYIFEVDWVGSVKLNLWIFRVIALPVVAGVIAGFYYLQIWNISMWVASISLLLFILSLFFKMEKFKMKGFLQRVLFGLMLLSSVGYIWRNGITGKEILSGFSDKVEVFLGLTTIGSDFVFGSLAQTGFSFAIAVLPTIIFFSAFMSVMYYLGIVQVIISAFAKFMSWSLGTSGAESLSCCSNIFVGQTEAPFMVKPYLKDMTNSELNAIMVGGFATIAGGVLAGYVQMGVSAGHLIAASIMSAPAALVVAKVIYPEVEESKTAGNVEMPTIDKPSNIIEAITNGASDGLKLAVNVAAMLIAFMALIGFVNLILGKLDVLIDGKLLGHSIVEGEEIKGIFPGSLATLFGFVFRPIAFVMGVPWADSAAVGNLLGLKITANEFVAYGGLSQLIKSGEVSQRAIIISTYALCGFANFSSIGIQIGGLSAIAPGRRSDLAKLGLKAMIGGAIASWITACIAGIFIV